MNVVGDGVTSYLDVKSCVLTLSYFIVGCIKLLLMSKENY